MTGARRTRPPRGAPVAAVAAVALLAGGVTAGAQGPGVHLAPDTFEVRGTRVPVERGRLVVPANRGSGPGATIALGFVRFRSTAAEPGAPIVFLAGGPGDAATRAFRGMPPDVLDALRAMADVVAFDQRGTGTSEPRGVLCPPGAPLPLDRPADRRHPGLVERMALLGVEGPDDTIKLPQRVDSVLAVIAAARRPALPGELRTLRARLAAEPARVALPGGGEIVLGEWDLQRWVAESLDLMPEIEGMLAAVPRMLDGDFEALARWSLRHRMPRPLNVMKLATDCASYASAGRLARVRREAPTSLVGDATDFPLPAVCDVPGLPRLPDEARAPVTSDTPALLVAGTWDGRTPPANAREVAGGMPRARVLVVEGASHGLFGDPAVMAAVLDFLGEGRAR